MSEDYTIATSDAPRVASLSSMQRDVEEVHCRVEAVRSRAGDIISRLECMSTSMADEVDVQPSQTVWTLVVTYSDFEYVGSPACRIEEARREATTMMLKLEYLDFSTHLSIRSRDFPALGRLVHDFEVWANVTDADQARIIQFKKSELRQPEELIRQIRSGRRNNLSRKFPWVSIGLMELICGPPSVLT